MRLKGVRTWVVLLGVLAMMAVVRAFAGDLGPVPEATSLDGPAPGRAPFDLPALKTAWRNRIEAARATGYLPIIDIESSFGGGKFNPAEYARLMDEQGIALTAFSAEAGRWDERTRILMALDPDRYIPTTGAGIPPHWPGRAEKLLEAEGIRPRHHRPH
jgi:hypothetical protein